MEEEIEPIEKNNSRELTTLPKGHRTIGIKWVNKTKKNVDGDGKRYKERLVAKGNNPSLFEGFKKDMSREFEMTDVGLMSYYLGLEVKQMEDGIFISQESYTKEILKKFNMLDCNPVNTPMESGTKLSKFDDGEKVDPTFFKSLT
ncbi:uncharacterized mitochondrial protein AtMg00810-like [Nicotiana sylvestris]|uniref:uncharacterized mitochondrial protein AtMg00810-like n=1 Tax=Nicotiana sylvestris TaxID=4096 RepID=UPI00388CB0DF